MPTVNLTMNLAKVKKVLNEKLLSLKKKINNKDHIVYELEADATIPSEYVILMHFLGDIDLKLENKIVNYLKNKQNSDGGWSLFYGGDSNLSTSVKAYFALKLARCDTKSEFMLKAKKCIIRLGGAEHSNVFTRITLALFKQISWKTVPAMPIEIMKLSPWFPFHLNKISYWSRTVLVPLLIILLKKPTANNPNNVNLNEIFNQNKNTFETLPPAKKSGFLFSFFKIVDSLLRYIEPKLSKNIKNSSLEEAYSWVIKRLNKEDGLGGIFPAMVNSLIALSIDDRNRFVTEIRIVKKSLKKLIIENNSEAYVQPCVSPIWDTGWVGITLLENEKNVDKFVDWLLKKEIKVKGDWAKARPNLKPGGWAFQYNNDFYPDVDDSALIGIFLHRYNKKNRNKNIDNCIKRTRDWILGMQSKNGGWGSFDADNTYSYLNFIPFADHGALLDPPTADVSARCLSFLAQIQNTKDKIETNSINQAVKYLLAEQEKDGSWFGRWGTNYIYGTWSVLSALNLVEFEDKKNVIRKAIQFLENIQNVDGGWGEDGRSYDKNFLGYKIQSTISQTSWALLALMSAGQIDSDTVKKGINFLTLKKNQWYEKYFTAVGFPKVFYLKYHGYSEYFPLLALSRYNNLISSNSKKPLFGV
ncbi:MAG: squalene--hopene cyclase [Rickettsiales bacterium]|nr:squalene--hopene cyclase [Rickettsiales bacterium]